MLGISDARISNIKTYSTIVSITRLCGPNTALPAKGNSMLEGLVGIEMKSMPPSETRRVIPINVIKNRMIEDTFNQVEELAREHRWIKTFGIVGVAFCVLFPFQPITGPITASIVGIIISLPSRINLLTVVIANTLSVAMWTYLYGELFDLTKNVNQGIVSLISVTAMVVLYVILYFLVVKKRIKKTAGINK